MQKIKAVQDIPEDNSLLVEQRQLRQLQIEYKEPILSIIKSYKNKSVINKVNLLSRFQINKPREVQELQLPDREELSSYVSVTDTTQIRNQLYELYKKRSLLLFTPQQQDNLMLHQLRIIMDEVHSVYNKEDIKTLLVNMNVYHVKQTFLFYTILLKLIHNKDARTLCVDENQSVMLTMLHHHIQWVKSVNIPNFIEFVLGESTRVLIPLIESCFTNTQVYRVYPDMSAFSPESTFEFISRKYDAQEKLVKPIKEITEFQSKTYSYEDYNDPSLNLLSIICFQYSASRLPMAKVTNPVSLLNKLEFERRGIQRGLKIITNTKWPGWLSLLRSIDFEYNRMIWYYENEQNQDIPLVRIALIEYIVCFYLFDSFNYRLSHLLTCMDTKELKRMKALITSVMPLFKILMENVSTYFPTLSDTQVMYMMNKYKTKFDYIMTL